MKIERYLDKRHYNFKLKSFIIKWILDAIEDLVLIMLHLTLDGENSKKTLPQLIIPTQELASYMRDLLNLNANSLLILHLLNPFE